MHYFEVLQKDVSNVPLAVCAVVNVLFLITTIVLSVLTNHPSTSTKVKHTVEYVYMAFTTFLTIYIASLLGYYGSKVHFRLVSATPGSKRAVFPHLKSPTAFLFMNWTLVLMYAFRGVLSLVVGVGGTHLPSDGQMTYQGGHGRTPLFPFVYYILVEILPCAIIAVFLWLPVRSSKRNGNSMEDDDEFHPEKDAKFDDLFHGGRGSTISRDGDSSVKVVISTDVINALQRQRISEHQAERASRVACSMTSGISSLTSASPQQQVPRYFLESVDAERPSYPSPLLTTTPGTSLTSPLVAARDMPPPTVLWGAGGDCTTAESGSSSQYLPPPSVSSSCSTGVAMMGGSSSTQDVTSPSPSPSSWLDSGAPQTFFPPLPPGSTPLRRPHSTGIGSSSQSRLAPPHTPLMSTSSLPSHARATGVLGGSGAGDISEEERQLNAKLYASELSPHYILRG